MASWPRRLRRIGHHSAFTLVELLVCIGVIATVVSLLSPSISAARASARRTICLTQLRQLGVAFVTYADAHKGRFPYADDSLDIPQGRAAPLDVIADELSIKLPAIDGPDSTDAQSPWHCPSDLVMAKRYGASYRYELWPLLALLGSGAIDQVSRIARDTSQVVLMRDGLAFHARAKTEEELRGSRGRNALRGDGSVFQQE